MKYFKLKFVFPGKDGIGQATMFSQHQLKPLPFQHKTVLNETLKKTVEKIFSSDFLAL